MKINKRFKKFLYIYALFFVLCFSVITMAKYTGKIDKSGNIKVAEWNISLPGEDTHTLNTIIIGENNTKDYNLNVTSLSDVAINYTITISNIPSQLIVTIDDETYQRNGNTIVASNTNWKFNANDTNSTHIHKLSFSVPDLESSTITNQSVTVDVTFTQVSP